MKNKELLKVENVGLVGENGAGKSTLMNILFGMESIHATGGYEGSIYLEGEKVNFASPVQALKAGFGMVHQEFSLIPSFTVSENMLLNAEEVKPNFISRLFGKKGKALETIDSEKCAKEA
ncbi:MAG: ATP-binding cassette domain-containing protein [Treponema sp.]